MFNSPHLIVLVFEAVYGVILLFFNMLIFGLFDDDLRADTVSVGIK